MGSIDRFIIPGSEQLARGPHSAQQRRRPWSPGDVQALLRDLHPEPSGKPGDRSQMRRELSSAFLAGVAESQDALMFRPRGSLAAASIDTARALLKNRAALQSDRLWHAFTAGERAGRATAGFASSEEQAALKLFIRQPFTESNPQQQALIASVLERIERCNGVPHRFHYLTGQEAQSADTFRTSFEADSGEPFTPQAFRTWRLARLAQADAFVNIRAGMSESSAFELSYHVFSGACTPVLFLVWRQAPIKTTLLKDLHDLCDVTYLEFDEPAELDAGINEFFRRCAQRATVCAAA